MALAHPPDRDIGEEEEAHANPQVYGARSQPAASAEQDGEEDGCGVLAAQHHVVENQSPQGVVARRRSGNSQVQLGAARGSRASETRTRNSQGVLGANRSEVGGSKSAVGHLLTFEGKNYLRRGVRLAKVMRGGAKIFKASKGSIDTWNMSEEVDELGAFISHNWVVARIFKFFCLAMHYNFNMALGAAAFSIVAITTLSGLDLLPRVAVSRAATGSDTEIETETGVCCTMLVAPIFLLVVCFGHNLRRRTPFVFLDKVCISQTNMEMMQEGISKLGAFIGSSQTLVIIYTDVYLTKLWTIYEIACFLSLHSWQSMIVVPTQLPVLTLGAIVIVYAVFLINFLLESTFQVEGTMVIGYAFGGTLLQLGLRWWARAKAAMYGRMANFRVEDCICYMEDDRAIVYKHIAELMRSIGVVDDGVADEDAREVFNTLVRTQMPAPMTNSIGRLCMRYTHVLAIFLVTYLPERLDRFPPGEGWFTRDRLSRVLLLLMSTCALQPLRTALIGWCCGRCLHLRGCKEVLYMVAVWMIYGWDPLIMPPLEALREASSGGGPNQDLCMAGLVLLLIALITLAVSVFNSHGCPELCSRKEAEKDTTEGQADSQRLEKKADPVAPAAAIQADPMAPAAAIQAIDLIEDPRDNVIGLVFEKHGYASHVW